MSTQGLQGPKARMTGPPRGVNSGQRQAHLDEQVPDKQIWSLEALPYKLTPQHPPQRPHLEGPEKNLGGYNVNG